MKNLTRRDALKWLLTLRDQQAIKFSEWPIGLRTELDALKQSSIVRIATPVGRRSPHLVVIDIPKLESRIASYSGDAPLSDLPVRAASIHAHGTSKGGGALPYLLINVLPGHTRWLISGRPVSLPTEDDVYSGLILKEGQPGPQPEGDVILVENREAWLGLRARLPERLKKASIIHYEGWLSSRLISVVKEWANASLWIAPDYDLVGFHNYFKLLEVRQDVKMLVPQVTDAEVAQWGSRELWAKQIDYLYSVRQWCANCPGPVASLFDRLSRLGTGMEQEFVLGISRLVWDIEKADPSYDEPAGVDAAH